MPVARRRLGARGWPHPAADDAWRHDEGGGALMRRRPALASPCALAGCPADLVAAIPTVEDMARDFAPLARSEVDAGRAFELAARYLSLEAWAGAVARILCTAASADGSE